MKITLIEIDYHAEVLRDFCIVLNDLSAKIQLFTTKKLWNQTGLSEENLPQIQVHIIQNRKYVQRVIDDNLSTIQESDIVLFNTLGSKYKYFSSINYKPKVILRIHNANTYFNPSAKIKLGTNRSEWWYSLRHIIWNTIGHLDWFYRKRFLKKVDYFLFPSEPIFDYASNLRPDLRKKMISTPIPMTFRSGIIKRPAVGERLIIVVPGRVDRKRRDYETVYKALAQLDNVKIELILLGKLHGKYAFELDSRLRSLGGGITIKTFKEFVPHSSYEREMNRAHFLLLPLRIETSYHIYEEKYGVSKLSGGESEMIRYSIPAIIPSNYNLSSQLAPHSITYSDENELSALLIRLIDNPHLKTSASPNCYELNKVANSVHMILEEAIS